MSLSRLAVLKMVVKLKLERSPRRTELAKKTWNEKLRSAEGLPKVVRLSPKMARRWGGRTCAIPSPDEIKELMGRIPKGKVTTVAEIRKAVARRHGAEIGCPLTCGIFVWIVANAANEDLESGRRRIVPYWRTLKAGGLLNPRYPGGVARHRKLLEAEGHRIEKAGEHYRVSGYEKKLVRL